MFFLPSSYLVVYLYLVEPYYDDSNFRTYPANEPEGNLWHIREDPVYATMHWLWHMVLNDGNTAR